MYLSDTLLLCGRYKNLLVMGSEVRRLKTDSPWAGKMLLFARWLLKTFPSSAQAVESQRQINWFEAVSFYRRLHTQRTNRPYRQVDFYSLGLFRMQVFSGQTGAFYPNVENQPNFFNNKAICYFTFTSWSNSFWTCYNCSLGLISATALHVND